MSPPQGPGRSHSIFRTVMLPLLLLVLAEAVFLLGSITFAGVVDRLNQNARDMLSQQVENRRSYLETAMVGSWSDLALLADSINSVTQTMLDQGTISLAELENSSEVCAPLLLEVSDQLISALYTKSMSGLFVVFNTQDLSQARATGSYPDKTGIYIRDLDPTSVPSQRNADLLLERAPIAVVRALNISTDTSWHPLFTFGPQQETDYYDFLYQPFQAAYMAETISDAMDYGYWSVNPFTLQGSTQEAISYSIPLVLDDGTVYGVLGVDLLTDYLRTMLPYGELFDDKQGSYLMAVDDADDVDDDALNFSTVLACGPALEQSGLPQSLRFTPFGSDGYTFHQDGRTYYASVSYFSLYNSNTPFVDHRWALIGAVPEVQLYAFPTQVMRLLNLAIFFTLIAGILGSLLISRRLSRPIRRLSDEVDRAQRDKGGIPHLSATGITEIDRFSHAITALSRDVVDSSTRFLQIMEMASVELGGFDIHHAEHTIFVTENYFTLFNRPEIDTSKLTHASFQALCEELHSTLVHTEHSDGSVLYQVPLSQGEVRYVRVGVTQEGDRSVGLAEDVTDATLERLRIEHERDYDLLTGLLNRRAFYRAANQLFRDPERLGHAALLMLDLDNLKRTNDRFGHDWGDQYIRQAGQCFADSIPPGTLCARVSGDEFFLFFYGYACQEDIRKALTDLRDAIRTSAFHLPSGEVTSISASGGVAWYPEDSTTFSALMKYADFAMYQVKQSRKGELADFDLGIYNREAFLIQSRREFQQLLEQELLSYHFQPIVDARSGTPAAYEALMRVDLPTLRTPSAVLQLAREEGRLQEIERLTWFKSSEAFQTLLDRGLVSDQALLFINSIASQRMEEADCTTLCQRYANLQPRMVIEITESDDLNLAVTQDKRNTPGFSGLFALDDYGSGYNSEKNLLALAPKFIKVDISIIRGIDSDPDKQQIVSNIVAYAHKRDMLIVAEGLETASELTCVLELGVDLLQGYFLARPAAIPSAVNPAALALIDHFRSAHP